MTRAASALFALLGLAWCAVADAALTLTDDRGTSVVLDQPAARIVTLAPHLAEIVFAAGAGSRLAGVSAGSDFPDAVKALPVVADAGRIDFERITALKPDLVLAWLSGNPARQIEQLERRGIRVLATEARHVDDVARLLRLVGTAAGSADQADQAARRYEDGVRQLASRYAQLPPLRVFVEIWHDPLISVSGAHLIGDVVRMCGGVNVVEAAPMLTPVVSAESLLAAQPQAVIMSVDAAATAERMARWQRFALIPAVRRRALYAVDPSLLERQGPRLLEAAQRVCEALALARAGNPG
jgi:iron complex transport system substrate-binding protein